MKGNATVEELDAQADALIEQARSTASSEAPPAPAADTAPLADASDTPAPETPAPPETPAVTEPPPSAEPPAPDVEDLRKEAETWQKRYKDIQRVLTPTQQAKAELERKVQEQEADLQRARGHAGTPPPEKEAAPPPAASEEEWQQFQSDYPEVAAALEKRIALALGPLTQQVEQARTEHEQGAWAQRVDRVSQAILQTHPDAAEIRDSEAFQQWLAEQPPVFTYIRDNAMLLDPRDTIHLLDTYRAAQSKPSEIPPARPVAPAPSAAQAAGAMVPRMPRGREPALTKKTYSPEEIAQLKSTIHRYSPEEQERVLAELDATLMERRP